MKIRSFLITFTAFTLSALTMQTVGLTSTQPAQAGIPSGSLAQSGTFAHKRSPIVGSWDFTGQVTASGATFKTVYQFFRDGNFLGVSSLIAPSLRTPLLGQWSVSGNQVTFKAKSFIFDASNQLTGSAITEATLTRTDDKLEGEATITVFDVNNNPTGQVTRVTLSGKPL
ncbi:hypothetical protein [Aetokthonos hydrillicola]|nr:hypothetical protein [Aetokthonos hydrillicola]MBO3460142.1 hypothetical protein [Aetokthonos hydrillicola CCALA 1050]MBW4590468.1 hypothetical protein [Aetokthonos hydrillicola CCALA 1050]